MRDRNLTGPWAGFAFKGDRLVTPEGHELLPEDLAWLSLTACIAQEWRTMMADTRRGDHRPVATGNDCASRDSGSIKPAAPRSAVVYLRDYVRRNYEKRSAQGDPGSGPETSPAAGSGRGRKSTERG